MSNSIIWDALNNLAEWNARNEEARQDLARLKTENPERFAEILAASNRRRAILGLPPQDGSEEPYAEILIATNKNRALVGLPPLEKL